MTTITGRPLFIVADETTSFPSYRMGIENWALVRFFGCRALFLISRCQIVNQPRDAAGQRADTGALSATGSGTDCGSSAGTAADDQNFFFKRSFFLRSSRSGRSCRCSTSLDDAWL